MHLRASYPPYAFIRDRNPSMKTILEGMSAGWPCHLETKNKRNNSKHLTLEWRTHRLRTFRRTDISSNGHFDEEHLAKRYSTFNLIND